MTPTQAARRLNLAADKLERQQFRIAAQTQDDLLRTAYRWSSGPLSLADLAKRDHPYARRHRTPLLSPMRINVQTGVFRASWVGVTRQGRGDALVQMFNTDPKAEQFLEPGTSRMFRRPIDFAIAREAFPRVEKRIDQALKSALSGLK